MLPRTRVEPLKIAMRGIEVPHEIGIDQRTHEGSGAEDELRER